MSRNSNAVKNQLETLKEIRETISNLPSLLCECGRVPEEDIKIDNHIHELDQIIKQIEEQQSKKRIRYNHRRLKIMKVAWLVLTLLLISSTFLKSTFWHLGLAGGSTLGLFVLLCYSVFTLFDDIAADFE